MVGCISVNIEYNAQIHSMMPLLIVADSGPSLLGRDWLTSIRLDWQQIHQVHNAPLLSVLDRYPNVWFQARIYVDPDDHPRFHPARSVPFALRDMVEQELE